MSGDDAPLSFGQQAIWLIEQFAPGNTGYINLYATMLVGDLDATALEAAFTTIVARHDSLRTRFRPAATDGTPRQWVEPAARCPLIRVDGPNIDADQRMAFVQTFARSEAARPFRLESDQLLRCHLICWSPREHTLLLLAHHIVVDGWSMTNLRHELEIAYNVDSRTVHRPLPKLHIQYPEFARQQRDQLTQERIAGELDFWRGYLDGVPGVLNLPTDKRRPEIQTFNGDVLHLRLPLTVLDQARSIAIASRSTLYVVFASVLSVVLHRYTNQRDILYGSPTVGRSGLDLEPLIGLFADTMVVRVSVDPTATLTDLLKSTRSSYLRASSHQDLPFHQVVQGLEVERRPGFPPVFQVSLSVNTLPDHPLELDGLDAEQMTIELLGARYDLTADFTPMGDGLRLRLQYNSDLFEKHTIRLLADHLLAVLAAGAHDLSTPIRELPRGRRSRAGAAARLLGNRIAAALRRHGPGATVIPRQED